MVAWFGVSNLEEVANKEVAKAVAMSAPRSRHRSTRGSRAYWHRVRINNAIERLGSETIRRMHAVDAFSDGKSTEYS